MANFAKIVSRIKHSTWTKAYIALGLLQLVVNTVLQCIIAAQNQYEGNLFVDSFYAIVAKLESDDSSVTEADLIFAFDGANRFQRMVWENFAFVAFQVWLLFMVVDATVYQNAAEVTTLAIINVLCPVVTGLEVMDARRWLKRLRDNESIPYGVSYIQTALYVEIALIVCCTLFSVIFLYISYEVVKDIGWVIYKKIGPDLQIQKMYRIFQFFVLSLKVGVFVQFFISVFYFVQYAIAGFEFEGFLPWDGYFCLAVTILMIPALFFARFAVAAERRWRMIVFIIFQLLVIMNMCLMLYQTSESAWYTWIVVVSLSVIVVLCTIALAAWCAYNFGKGLKPHVQRGRSTKKEPAGDAMETEPLDRSQSVRSWKIDG